jgi:protein O-mannosyl-transferase
MGSKETMVTAPILVWLWDRVFADHRPPREPLATRVPLYAGLAATWAILTGLMLAFPRSHSVGFHFAEWPWWRYLMTQAGVVAHYCRLALVPSPLVLEDGWPPASSAEQVAPQALLLLALIGNLRGGPAHGHSGALRD